MSKPTASFSFIPNGLSVKFTDRSSGIINSWAWDFGNSTNSVAQNPPDVVYSSAGTYVVTLTSTNSEGSSTFQFPIMVAATPILNLSIRQQVMYGLPSGIALDEIALQQGIMKWQLFLQPLMNPDSIPNSDVFNETKWVPMANVLISKLVIYDMVQKAAASSMTAFISALSTYNALASQISTSTMLVSDYSVPFVFSNPTLVNLIIIDGVSYTSSTPYTDLGQVLTYLNSLGRGVFAVSGGNLVSLGNSHILTTFNYTANSIGSNGAFTQSNSRVVAVNQVITTSGGSTGIGKGPLKHLEAGPSKVEWYDSSVYWSNLMRDFSPKFAGGQQGGVMGMLIQDICMYAKRLNIYNLEMCSFKAKFPTLFITSKRWC